MSNNIVIEYNPNDTLRRTYRLRPTGREGTALETTIPREVVEREARRNNMAVDEFVKKFDVAWFFDSFDGMHLTFVLRE